MSDNMVKNIVIIMCKAPIEGKVKTRLMTAYTAKQAMQLHQAMAMTVIERAKRLFEHVWLAVDDVQHPFFKPFDLPLHAQGIGDLGERMSRLMLQAIQQGHENILFLGTDSPHMPDLRLMEAFEALKKPLRVNRRTNNSLSKMKTRGEARTVSAPPTFSRLVALSNPDSFCCLPHWWSSSASSGKNPKAHR